MFSLRSIWPAVLAPAVLVTPSTPGAASEIVRVSIASDGLEANGSSYAPAISADGRFIAFTSAATNLVSGDHNGVDDVFVHDLSTGETTRVSIASDRTEADAASAWPSISGDGRFVAFHSDATTLTSDPLPARRVYVHDRSTGETTSISPRQVPVRDVILGEFPATSTNGRWVCYRGRREPSSSRPTPATSGSSTMTTSRSSPSCSTPAASRGCAPSGSS